MTKMYLWVSFAFRTYSIFVVDIVKCLNNTKHVNCFSRYEWNGIIYILFVTYPVHSIGLGCIHKSQEGFRYSLRRGKIDKLK